ncbi:MAG: chemotaxis protein CheY [Sulfurovum sp. AS07-7]|nr:MAG: chemotaxis protein CheY [Sulfurovum sp. AS07-7]
MKVKNRPNEIEIVIIEDEQDMLELLEYIFQKEGYRVTGFLSTDKVEQFLEEENPSILIVDRNLPKVDGADFVANLRKLGYAIPVIFLTAKDRDSDIIEGFDSGGDDYITKPFKPKELLARVSAVLKRSGISQYDKLKYRDIVIDCKSQDVMVGDAYVNLTNLEFKLLELFIKNSHQVLTRDFLRDAIWEDDGDFNDKTINVALSRLKKKIDPKEDKNYFTPIWGVGYKLT